MARPSIERIAGSSSVAGGEPRDRIAVFGLGTALDRAGHELRARLRGADSLTPRAPAWPQGLPLLAGPTKYGRAIDSFEAPSLPVSQLTKRFLRQDCDLLPSGTDSDNLSVLSAAHRGSVASAGSGNALRGLLHMLYADGHLGRTPPEGERHEGGADEHATRRLNVSSLIDVSAPGAAPDHCNTILCATLCALRFC